MNLRITPLTRVLGLSFTGYFLVKDWQGEVKRMLFYEKGELIDSRNVSISHYSKEENNRAAVSSDCYFIDDYFCVESSGGGFHYIRCSYEGTTLVCPESPELAGPEPSNPQIGGGGPSDTAPDSLCPHPYIDGLFVSCDKVFCTQGQTVDESGNCVEEKPLDRINNCDGLTSTQKNQLEAVLDNYLTKCTNLQIFEYVVGEEKKFCFKVDGSINNPGGFNHNTGEIIFKSSQNINLTTFTEEFFHGYQHTFYGGLGQYTNTGRSNIEFEAKLYHDLIYGGLGYCCLVYGDSNVLAEYLLWLLEITNDFTKIPTWSDMQDKYYFFLEEFIKDKPMYSYPIDYNLQPNALLNLTNC